MRAGRDLVIAAPQPEGADDLTVLADPDRLHQILLNLLHNAVKFTPDGGCITLCAARWHGTVVLAVTDTGPGIAAKARVEVRPKPVERAWAWPSRRGWRRPRAATSR